MSPGTNDNLEPLMASQAPETSLGILVLFNQPLDTLDLPGLGITNIRAIFPTVNGVATDLNPADITALAAQGVVVRIENDDSVQAP